MTNVRSNVDKGDKGDKGKGVQNAKYWRTSCLYKTAPGSVSLEVEIKPSTNNNNSNDKFSLTWNHSYYIVVLSST